jgi:hypothetical protein
MLQDAVRLFCRVWLMGTLSIGCQAKKQRSMPAGMQDDYLRLTPPWRNDVIRLQSCLTGVYWRLKQQELHPGLRVTLASTVMAASKCVSRGVDLAF